MRHKMLLILTEKLEIKEAQAKLEKTIKKEFSQKRISNIGYPGGIDIDAAIFSDGKYWCMFEDNRSLDAPNPRRLNWFGKILEKRDQEITVEINTPFEGRKDMVAGFFARDIDTNITYLLHSGKVGGGKKGVRRDAFLAWLNEKLHSAADKSGKERLGVIVMPVEGAGAVNSLKRYIDSISLFKKLVREGGLETEELQELEKKYKNYYQESSGRRKRRRKSEFDYLSRHGDVVAALNRWRIKQGLSKFERIVKDQYIDMGVLRDEKLIELYEIKTGLGRQNLYTAIGQLIVHSANSGCSKVLILPKVDSLSSDFEKILKTLDIKRMSYTLNELEAYIED